MIMRKILIIFVAIYQIDAKSILGLMGIGLERECVVVLIRTDEYVKNKFKEDMKLWALED